MKTLTNKNSIYSHFRQFKEQDKLNSLTEADFYITRYYLKLQADAYCKMHKIKQEQFLTQELKDQILSHISK